MKNAEYIALENVFESAKIGGNEIRILLIDYVGFHKVEYARCSPIHEQRE